MAEQLPLNISAWRNPRRVLRNSAESERNLLGALVDYRHRNRQYRGVRCERRGITQRRAAWESVSTGGCKKREFSLGTHGGPDVSFGQGLEKPDTPAVNFGVGSLDTENRYTLRNLYWNVASCYEADDGLRIFKRRTNVCEVTVVILERFRCEYALQNGVPVEEEIFGAFEIREACIKNHRSGIGASISGVCL